MRGEGKSHPRAAVLSVFDDFAGNESKTKRNRIHDVNIREKKGKDPGGRAQQHGW
jgi:hypothetical protein